MKTNICFYCGEPIYYDTTSATAGLHGPLWKHERTRVAHCSLRAEPENGPDASVTVLPRRCMNVRLRTGERCLLTSGHEGSHQLEQGGDHALALPPELARVMRERDEARAEVLRLTAVTGGSEPESIKAAAASDPYRQVTEEGK